MLPLLHITLLLPLIIITITIITHHASRGYITIRSINQVTVQAIRGRRTQQRYILRPLVHTRTHLIIITIALVTITIIKRHQFMTFHLHTLPLPLRPIDLTLPPLRLPIRPCYCSRILLFAQLHD